jgi:uncharacterized membrane protein YdjX (TVP38/TMEM64 family)
MDSGALAGDPAGRRAALRRLAIYGACLGTTVVVLAITGSLPSAGEVRNWGEDLGDLGVALYVPLFVVLNFAIAWAILAGAGGLLFGTAVGTPLALLGVTFAALAQMAVARRLAGEHVGFLLPPRTRGLERFLERNGAVAVMESRIVPLLPYGLVNYSAGLTRLTFRAMGVGTLVGAGPKVFGYVALGGNLSNLRATEAKVAVALLVVLAVVGALIVRRQVLAERRAASA